MSLVVGKIDERSSFDDVLANYRRSLSRLRAFGVPIPRASRLREYERRFATLLAQKGDPLLVSSDSVVQLLFHYREIDEINFIVDNFSDPPTQDELNALRLLSRGADDPDSEQASKSRDAQFELFLRAAFLQAGAVVRFGSPDLRVASGSASFPVEAKRPTSDRAVDDRLRDAVSQLENIQEIGCAALSLDQVIRPRGAFLTVENESALGEVIRRLVDNYLAANLRTLVSRARGKRVAAFLFVFRVPGLVRDSNLTLLGTNFSISAVAAPWEPGHFVVSALETLISRVSA